MKRDQVLRKIEIARRAAGITQTEAAEAAGFSSQRWNMIERGSAPCPDVDVLRRMADAVGLRLRHKVIESLTVEGRR